MRRLPVVTSGWAHDALPTDRALGPQTCRQARCVGVYASGPALAGNSHGHRPRGEETRGGTRAHLQMNGPMRLRSRPLCSGPILTRVYYSYSISSSGGPLDRAVMGSRLSRREPKQRVSRDVAAREVKCPSRARYTACLRLGSSAAKVRERWFGPSRPMGGVSASPVC